MRPSRLAGSVCLQMAPVCLGEEKKCAVQPTLSAGVEGRELLYLQCDEAANEGR